MLKQNYKYILFNLIISLNFLLSNTITISGDINDKDTGEPIPYANIVLIDTNLGSSSDIDGHFIIPRVPIQNYTLRVMVIGYKTLDMKILENDNNIKLQFNLEKSIISLDEINISAERTRFQEKVEISTINLSNRDIRRAPAFIEADVFRTIQLLPSVTASNDFNAALIVRGGSPDENMILLDGAEIYNPYHIGGIFSTFNSNMIADTEFLAGGFPAEYNGRLSSVLNITSKNGDSKNSKIDSLFYYRPIKPFKWEKKYFADYKMKEYFNFSKANCEINTLSSKILAEGALYKGSWIFSARRTYFDKFISIYYNSIDEQEPFKYYFWDIHFKGLINLNQNNQLSYSQFSGKDDLYLNLGGDDFPGINFGWDWGNYTQVLSWKHLPNSNYFIETNISKTEYKFDVDFAVDFESSSNEDDNEFLPNLDDDESEESDEFNSDIEFKTDNIVKDITLRQTLNYFPSEFLKIKMGWEYKQIKMKYVERFSGQEYFRLESEPSIKSVFYSNVLNPFPVFRINTGFIISDFNRYDKIIIDPRIGLKYTPTSDLAIKASWGKYSQFLYTINQEEELLRVVDFWQPIPDGQKPQSSEHYIIGAEYWISEGNIFSIEAYYKPYLHLYDLNPRVQPDDPTTIAVSGTGEAYGLELLYRLNINKFSGWISYSYSDITRTVDLNSDGQIWEEKEKYNAKYNKPHNFSSVISYDLNSNITIAASCVISSGQTYTPVTGKVHQASQQSYGSLEKPYSSFGNIFGARNSSRYPTYFRTDLSLSQKKKSKWFGFDYIRKFQIINLTNHYNVLLYNFDHQSSPSRVSAYSMFPIFFSFGWEFKL